MHALGTVLIIPSNLMHVHPFAIAESRARTYTHVCVQLAGPEKYSAALKVLFDPAASRADLLAISAPDDHTVVLRWRLEGALRLGGLRIKPYTGTTVYTISDAGQVARHEETWDISTLDAFVSTFVPSFGAPPAPHVK